MLLRSGGLRAVHQAVLRHFAATGIAPAPRVLESVAARSGRTAGQVLAELGAEDFLTLDPAGRIRAAYPWRILPIVANLGCRGSLLPATDFLPRSAVVQA